MFGLSSPSFVVVAESVLEIIDGEFWGIPQFSQNLYKRFFQKVDRIYARRPSTKPESMNDIYRAVFAKN